MVIGSACLNNSLSEYTITHNVDKPISDNFSNEGMWYMFDIRVIFHKHGN